MLWRRYCQILGGFFSLNAVLLVFATAFPDALLWILGPKYTHLKAELFLMMLCTVLGSLLGTMYQLNLTRGWVVSPWLLIPIGVATEVFLIIVLDMSQVRDVLLMGIFSTIPGFFLNLLRTRRGIREAQHTSAATLNRVRK